MSFISYHKYCYYKNCDIDNTKCEKHSRVKFDQRLTFDNYVSDLSQKPNRKINALARIAPYMNLSKKRLLMNALFTSQFNYCPFLWKCHSQKKIN